MKTKAEAYAEALKYILDYGFDDEDMQKAFIQLILKGVETQQALAIILK